MSEYRFEAILKAKFDKQTIHAILQRGADMGILYFDFIIGIQYGNAPVIDVESAVEKVLAGQKDFENLYAAYVRIQDTQCHLSFSSTPQGLLRFSMFDFSFEWQKCFFQEVCGIDLARYTYVFLELIKDFRILELKEGTEDFIIS